MRKPEQFFSKDKIIIAITCNEKLRREFVSARNVIREIMKMHKMKVHEESLSFCSSNVSNKMRTLCEDGYMTRKFKRVKNSRWGGGIWLYDLRLTPEQVKKAKENDLVDLSDFTPSEIVKFRTEWNL